MKQTVIIPVYNKGNSVCVQNYRRVRTIFLNTLLKVLDNLSYNFKRKLNFCHHYFLKSKSTITNLVSYLAYRCLSIGSKNQGPNGRRDRNALLSHKLNFLQAVWRTDHLVALTVMSSQAKELTEKKTVANGTSMTLGPFSPSWVWLRRWAQEQTVYIITGNCAYGNDFECLVLK